MGLKWTVQQRNDVCRWIVYKAFDSTKYKKETLVDFLYLTNMVLNMSADFLNANIDKFEQFIKEE